MGKLSAALIADLTASIPSDVVISAHQHWLPNLGTEMAGRKDTKDQDPGGWTTTIRESRVAVDSGTASIARASPRAEADPPVEAAKSAPAAVAAKPAAAAPDAPPRAKAADQTDDLLFPTEEELRASKAGAKDVKPAAQPQSADAAPSADANPQAGVPANSDAAVAQPQTRSAPAVSIESSVEPENWAEYGGWYRQDYAIFYRPTGHKDKLIYSWLTLTGPQAPKGDKSPAAAVFESLTGKDAQGSCTKCHSVDDVQGKGRMVNFSPLSADNRKGRFTQFIHEPHLSVVESRGCLTCHELEKGRPYLKSYEQGNPHNFASNFGAVKKELCQTCHTSTMVRQDCLTCHKYHVDGVTTPIMDTKIPTE